MIDITTSKSKQELEGILLLQKANLARTLSHELIQSQGFVTVDHSFEQLESLNNFEQHVIAKDGDRVIAYLLAMTEHSRNDIPVLIPMFDSFTSVKYKGKPVCEYNYIVVGQVCVATGYRGMGILDECYTTYRRLFSGRYDFAITEIVHSNLRSLRAHKRVGFEVIHSYRDADDTEWSIVVWDWN